MSDQNDMRDFVHHGTIHQTLNGCDILEIPCHDFHNGLWGANPQIRCHLLHSLSVASQQEKSNRPLLDPQAGTLLCNGRGGANYDYEFQRSLQIASSP